MWQCHLVVPVRGTECGEAQSRTEIACSSDKCLDHLGYFTNYLIVNYFFRCGPKRTRTSDIFDVNEALYQLSYGSVLGKGGPTGIRTQDTLLKRQVL